MGKRIVVRYRSHTRKGVGVLMAHNVEHIRRQGFEILQLVYFRKFNQCTKAESLHFCPAFVYVMLAVVLFVKRK
jgi:hypothetical protein